MLQRSTTISTTPNTTLRATAHAILISIAIASTVLTGVWVATTTRSANAATPIESTVESQLVTTTNEQRMTAGLAPLQWNAGLYAAATAKAADMLHNQYFDHIAPDGTTPWMFITKHYSYESAGENLAVDFRNPLDAVPAWMQSPSHRANILDTKFRDVGIVVTQGTLNGRQTTLIVQMFGEPTTTLTSILTTNFNK